jgi:transcriptional regulator with XRE-family HTH domain
MHKIPQQNLSSTVCARERLTLNLKKWRAFHGLSQHALAIEAGLHHTFVAHLERGARNPSLDNIEKLAVALKIDIVELLCDPRSRTHPEGAA